MNDNGTALLRAISLGNTLLRCTLCNGLFGRNATQAVPLQLVQWDLTGISLGMLYVQQSPQAVVTIAMHIYASSGDASPS